MYGRLFGDTLGNVNVSTQASYAHISRIRLNGKSALTAEAIGKKKSHFTFARINFYLMYLIK